MYNKICRLSVRFVGPECSYLFTFESGPLGQISHQPAQKEKLISLSRSINMVKQPIANADAHVDKKVIFSWEKRET